MVVVREWTWFGHAINKRVVKMRSCDPVHRHVLGKGKTSHTFDAELSSIGLSYLQPIPLPSFSPSCPPPKKTHYPCCYCSLTLDNGSRRPHPRPLVRLSLPCSYLQRLIIYLPTVLGSFSMISVELSLWALLVALSGMELRVLGIRHGYVCCSLVL